MHQSNGDKNMHGTERAPKCKVTIRQRDEDRILIVDQGQTERGHHRGDGCDLRDTRNGSADSATRAAGEQADDELND